MICTKCAGAGRVDRYNPATKRIETVPCGPCGGSGTVNR
jgi:DnaJ-class molecular chaperone